MGFVLGDMVCGIYLSLWLVVHCTMRTRSIFWRVAIALWFGGDGGGGGGRATAHPFVFDLSNNVRAVHWSFGFWGLPS